MTYNRIDLNKRISIQNGLDNHQSLSQIALDIGVSLSSVSREIRNHKISSQPISLASKNRCIHRKDCHISSLCPARSVLCKNKRCSQCSKVNCTISCPDFQEEHCLALSRPPYVCNGCLRLSRCPLQRSFYKAADADRLSVLLRSESRSGLNLTQDELREINDLLSPLLKRGQSIHHIFASQPDLLPICEKQAYNLIRNGLLDARPIDTPRMVRFKPRDKKSSDPKVDKKCRIGRSYQDYLNYMESNPDETVLEGDSVIGIMGGKCVLTLTWAQWDFQIAFLRDHNNAASVTQIVNHLYESLGYERFQTVIPSVWLLDNGSEFSDPTEIEKYGIHVFYCDPGSPQQKPHCENTHAHIRRVLPKGTSFNELSQEFFNDLMSQINAIIRKKLNDHSSHMMFSSMFGEDVCTLLGVHYVDPKELDLTPQFKHNWLKAHSREE